MRGAAEKMSASIETILAVLVTLNLVGLSIAAYLICERNDGLAVLDDGAEHFLPPCFASFSRAPLKAAGALSD